MHAVLFILSASLLVVDTLTSITSFLGAHTISTVWQAVHMIAFMPRPCFMLALLSTSPVCTRPGSAVVSVHCSFEGSFCVWHGSHTSEALKSSAVSWTYAIKAGHGRVKLCRICVVCVWLGSVSGPCCLRLSGICLAGVASLLVGVTAQQTVVYLAVMFAPRLSHDAWQ